MTTNPILTVSQLNHTAREILEQAFATILVEGEISNLSCPSSGHIYFSLKDENAQVRCALFRNRRIAPALQLKNGLHIIARAQVSLYEGRGDFQLIVEHVEEAGIGKLQRAFEALKQKLAKEGLFDPAHKQELPALPTQIGIITSPTGAAIKDVLHVLNRRFPAIPIIIYPTQVQGELAAAQIVKAIKLANQRQECDILLLTRGGGSLEDLWPFNEEIVARAIYQSKLPIVSAVGHEIDFAIADFVADVRAPTPSAAAELMSPNQIEWLQNYTKLQQRLQFLMQHILNHSLQLLLHLQKRLRHPGDILRERMQRVDQLEQQLQKLILNLIANTKTQLTSLMRALNTVSPLATLDRGYSIVSHEKTNKIIHNYEEINSGDRLQIKLAQGFVIAITEASKKN